jgi:UDP-N-acetylmuramoyl-L-alanyl-D-glutamate--2,6-diaminopimelate ligase
MNGHAGVPWTIAQRAHARDTPPDALVVEIGIDAPGAMVSHVAVVDPDVAVLTALGVEHLAGLGSWETAIAEEMRLFEPRPGRRRVWPAHDPAARARLAGVRAGDVVVCEAGEAHAILGELGAGSAEALAARGIEVVTFEATLAGLACDVVVERVAADGRAAGAFRVPMPGRHAGASFALAAATALALGRTMDDLALGLAAFAPPPMRLAPVALANGGLLLDDTYNASPPSLRAALDVLADPALAGRPRVLVLGDLLDLGDATAAAHAEVATWLEAFPDAAIGLVGAAMRDVHARLGARPGARVAWIGQDEPPERALEALVGGAPWRDALASAVVLVKGSRGLALERLAHAIVLRTSDDPAVRLAAIRGRLRAASVTGTNGKTTTSTMLAAIVTEAGEPAARVTTVGAWVDGARIATDASAEAFVVTAERAAAAGVRTIVVETTSLALASGFADHVPPDVAVFTNLTHDHLDVHGSPEGYLAAKARLFLALGEGGVAVLNAADPASALLDEVIAPDVRRAAYAARPVDEACAGLPIALAARSVHVGAGGTRVELEPSPLAARLGGVIDLGVVGAVYAEDALAAAVAADALGYPAAAIRRALDAFAGVPGRFEIVARRPTVVVDYAHTPDALERTLVAARALVGPGGALRCVFGCGGDRDPDKRPVMGRVAGALADVVVITTDNPRHEDPEAIADAIARGAEGSKATLRRISDRALAIAGTLGEAGAADVVVIAGKGHEATQIVGDDELPFDDAAIARATHPDRGEGR